LILLLNSYAYQCFGVLSLSQGGIRATASPQKLAPGRGDYPSERLRLPKATASKSIPPWGKDSK